MNAIHFIRPEAFWGMLVLLLIPFLARSGGKSGGVWRRICDPELLEALLVRRGGRRLILPLFLLSAGWFLTVAALTGPAFEKLPQPAFSKGADTVYLLDVSPLSGVRDVKPDRLSRARFKLFDFLKKNVGGQSALVLYGETPFVAVPLTPDPKMIESVLPTVQTGLIGDGAPDLSAALNAAGALLRQAGSVGGHVIVFGSYADEKPVEAAESLNRDGYRVSVLGIGTETGTPVKLSSGRFMTTGGRAVLSGLTRRNLEKIAKAGNGLFRTLSVGGDDIDSLLSYSNGDRRDGGERDLSVKADEWKDCGIWLVFPVMLCMFFGFRKGWLAAVVLAVTVTDVHAAWYDFWKRPDRLEAERIMRGEKPSDAFVFDDPSWRGAADYRRQEFDSAAEGFEQSSSLEDMYNYGNALAHAGKLREAVGAYDAVLKKAPDHADAAFNKKYLEELLKKQQQNRKNQQQQNQQQQNRQDKQDKRNEQQQDQQQNRQQDGQDQNQTGSNSQNQEKGDKQTGASPEKQQALAEENENGREKRDDRSFVPEKGDENQKGKEGQLPSAGLQQTKEDKEKQEQKQWLSIIEDDPSGLLRERIRRHNLKRRRKR